MRRVSVWIIVLCGFIVGIFVGIHMDWSAHKRLGRNLVFEVQDYQMANLQVYPGDKLSLALPSGRRGSAAMSWTGNNPCVDKGNGSRCTIAPYKSAPTGAYFFKCNSSEYSCPDPGVQQSPTGPFVPTTYGAYVKRDFAHLFGIHDHHEHQPEPPPTTGEPVPANTSIPAIASCSNGKTVLQDPNGNNLTTINASVGQTVYWIDPNGLSLDFSGAPAGLCQGGNPGSGVTQQAKCTITQTVASLPYKVTAQSTPACVALSATLTAK